jgi:hypothetical protein
MHFCLITAIYIKYLAQLVVDKQSQKIVSFVLIVKKTMVYLGKIMRENAWKSA